jgi:hypothetical protein
MAKKLVYKISYYREYIEYLNRIPKIEGSNTN